MVENDEGIKKTVAKRFAALMCDHQGIERKGGKKEKERTYVIIKLKKMNPFDVFKGS